MPQQRGIVQSSRNIDAYKHVPRSYPFVKWAGGKSQIMSELDALIPSEFDRYFEPFLGGGAMFFHISSKNIQFASHLSDINEDLINAYKVVKDNVEILIRLLKHNEKVYKNSRHRYYYKLRAINPLTDVERTARFITLNKTCYNGLYRVNSKGLFNVPMGRYKNPVICDSENLRKVSIALRDSDAKIEAIDYEDILLRNSREGDFIYLDPPYDPLSDTAYFTHYTHHGFTVQDQKKLAEIFVILSERKCKVLLSNSHTLLVKKLYKHIAKHIKELRVLRSINSKASKRIGHKELLIRNYSL